MNFTDLVDLAAERLGGKALSASDEFFAEKENLLKAAKPVFIEGKYTDRGKWMDGWESRRRRGPGHDWCVIKLGLPGIVRGVDVATHHFTGNYPEHASLDGSANGQDWVEILPISKLKGDSSNLFAIDDDRRFTHVRLHIYPDGGVARLRVYGEVAADLKPGQKCDLAAVENGGLVVACNDSFFGPKDNLIMPGASVNMGDGWETKRKRGPGNDWVVVRLGSPGTLERVIVDTSHFKGNYPDRCALDGVRLPWDAPADYLGSRAITWEPILPETKLEADRLHEFDKELRAGGPYSHIRLSIFPDGGIARLRLFGVVA